MNRPSFRIDPRRRWPAWLLSFLAFFLVSSAWALGSPMSTSPDEPSHMVKAVATARGEFTYATIRHEVKGGYEKYWLGFDMPAKYNTLDAMSACFRFQLKSASCGKPFGTDGSTAVVETSAGQYNPLYYFPVGLPSLFLPGTSALYGMRLMSALLNSALLAGAVSIAARWRRPGWPVLGVLVCSTPMMLFLNGTVNPNGLEASAAVLAWTAALSLVLDHRPELVVRRAAALTVGAALLANTRSLGVPWVLAILASAVFMADKKTLVELGRRKIVWITGGVAALGMALALWWTSYSTSFTPPTDSFPTLKAGYVASVVFYNSGNYIREIIGNLGWLDVPLPPGTTYGWFATLGLIAVAALGCTRWRECTVLIALIIGTVVIPVVAQVLEAKQFGIGWQGRYILAWCVGVPILAGLVVSRRVGWQLPRDFEFKVPIVGAVLLGVGGIAAFYWSFLRYAQAEFENYWPLHIKWAPPGGWILSWLLYLAGAVFLVAVVCVRNRLLELDERQVWTPEPVVLD